MTQLGSEVSRWVGRWAGARTGCNREIVPPTTVSSCCSMGEAPTAKASPLWARSNSSIGHWVADSCSRVLWFCQTLKSCHSSPCSTYYMITQEATITIPIFVCKLEEKPQWEKKPSHIQQCLLFPERILKTMMLFSIIRTATDKLTSWASTLLYNQQSPAAWNVPSLPQKEVQLWDALTTWLKWSCLLH